MIDWSTIMKKFNSETLARITIKGVFGEMRLFWWFGA